MSDNNAMRCCLVTGAAGFLGAQLIRKLLLDGYVVRALVRKPVSLPFDVETMVGELGADDFPYASVLAGVDTVFHLAGKAHAHAAADCYQRDCMATIELARQAQTAGVSRFVFVSSTRAMAEPDNFVMDESYAEWPSDPYGYWKRKTEQLLLSRIGIPHLTILRPCLVYGVGVKGNLANMIRAISRGFFPALPNIAVERSMVSVIDVANALVLVARHSGANRQALIIADGQPYTPYSLYVAILGVMGRPVPIRSVPLWLLKTIGRLGDVIGFVWKSCPASSETVHRLTSPAVYSAGRLIALGWLPTTTFYEQLPSMVAASLESHS